MSKARIGALPIAAASSALVVVACVVTLVTTSALPLVLVAVGVSVVAYAPRIGWRLATAVVLLAVMVLQVCLAWATAHVPGSLATDNVVAWTLFGLVHAVQVRALPPTRGRASVVDLAAVLLVPAVVGAYFAWTAITADGAWLNWAMRGDSANNMILNRSFIGDGGLLRSQGNGAPLATVLHASWTAPGVQLDDPAGTVREIVLGSGELTLILLALVGLAGSFMAIERHPAGSGRRFAAGAAVATIPWLWCVSGYVFGYGYQNAAPGMLVLALAWICWTEQRRHPVTAVTGLVLATWAAATAWGPVLLVPACWLVVATVRQRRGLRAAGRDLWLPAVTLAGAAAYALLVTLRDLRTQGGVPGADGGHPPIDQQWVTGVAIGLAVLVLVLHRWIRPDLRWGFWAAVPAVGLSMLQLVRAREDSPLGPWGYYPVKYTWIVLSVALLVAFAESQPAVGRVARRLWNGNGVAVTLVATIALLTHVAPLGGPTTVGGALTPVYFHDDVALDPIHAQTFRIMDIDPRTVVSRYYTEPNDINAESVTNFWLLQSSASYIGDPIRNPAYLMNSRDPAGLCWAITEAHGDLTILTRDDRLERRLARDCQVDPTTYEVVSPEEFFEG